MRDAGCWTTWLGVWGHRGIHCCHICHSFHVRPFNRGDNHKCLLLFKGLWGGEGGIEKKKKIDFAYECSFLMYGCRNIFYFTQVLYAEVSFLFSFFTVDTWHYVSLK